MRRKATGQVVHRLRTPTVVGTGIICGSLLVAACGSDPESGDEPYYAGETIELIVPFDTGGGSDATARLMASVLSDTIEGQPDVNVRNLPGGGTLIGHHEFANSEPDGYTLFQGTSTGHVYQIFGNPDAEFDYADWEPLLGIPQGTIYYASADTGISSAEDIAEADEDLVLGAGSAGGNDLGRLMAIDLLGVPFQPVFGFSGSGETRLAFLQGQTNLSFDATASYLENILPEVETGGVVPLFTLGQLEGGELVADAAFPDLPAVDDVYEQINGEPLEGVEAEALKLLISAATTMNKVLFVQDDVPQEAKDALNAGIERMLEDERYVDGMEDLLGGYETISGDAVKENLADITNPDPDAVEWAATYAEEKYDVDMQQTEE